MHGRIKVRTSAQQEALKKIEREKKLAEYKAAVGLVFKKRKEEAWDDELLLITERMVLQNADINTLWNIRRQTFQKNHWPQEERTQRLTKELTLTENCLRENPKAYGIWHHRCWVIDNLAKVNWKAELELCAECLNLDERNFHCWDYRQYLVKKASISDAEEFDFSTTKILNNFSNYSSWHYRSKILAKMFPDENGQLPIRADKHKEELDLVMNATFTDPNDSSAWFYQRWLLDCSQTKGNTLWRARVTSTRATIVFHKDVRMNRPENGQLLFQNEDGVNRAAAIEWESPGKKEFSKSWIANLIHHSNEFATARAISIKFEGHAYHLYPNEKKDAWLYKTRDNWTIKHNEAQLKEQMESYRQLSILEPNNKWSLLTGIYLMKNYNFVEYNSKILNDIDALKKVDGYRLNYYNDMRSKCIIDYTLHDTWRNEAHAEMSSAIDLSGLDLTVLSNEHYFTFFHEVNLGANKLTNSLARLAALQDCKKLSLSSNGIESLKNMPILSNLEILSLRNNRLSSVQQLLHFVKRHPKLSKLDLRDNCLGEMHLVAPQIYNAASSTLELLMDQ